MNHGRMPGILAVTATSALWGTTGTAATFAPEAGPLAIGSAALGLSGLLQALVAARALRKESPSLTSHGAAIAVGAVGSILLCMSNFEAGGAGTAATVVGIGLGLVAGGTYATYSRSVQRLMHERISRAAAMGAVFGCGGALLMPVLLATGGPLVASRQAVLVAAYVTLVPMFVGYLLFSFGLTRIPVRTATTITLLEPAFASLFAVLVVGERLTALGWVGMALLGIVLIALALEPRPSPEAEAGETADLEVASVPTAEVAGAIGAEAGGAIAMAAAGRPSHQSDI